jgi:hypothetical protein
MRIRNSNFEIQIQNSESKFEKCLLTKLDALPQTHIIDMLLLLLVVVVLLAVVVGGWRLLLLAVVATLLFY